MMRSLVERFLALCRRLLGRRRVQGRTDDLAERESLDQIWRAECTEMAAILERKDPGRDRR